MTGSTLKKAAAALVITIIGALCLLFLKPQYFPGQHELRRKIHMPKFHVIRFEEDTSNISVKHLVPTKTLQLFPPSIKKEENRKNVGNHFEEETSNISVKHLDPATTSPLVPPSQQKKKEIFENLMKERQNKIRKYCQKQKVKQTVNRQVLYYREKDSLLWCPVFKAASTNWMENMMQLTGKTEEEIEKIRQRHPNQPNSQAREVAPIPSFSLLANKEGRENFTSLLVVRHPFTRLVSAFRDKLERCHAVLVDNKTCNLARDYYYNQYGKAIVQNYRASYLAKFGDVSLSSEHNLGALFPVIRSRKMPTWWEFVQSLLHSSTPRTWDPHWRPTFIYCTPCSLNFNTVIKFEQIEYEEGLLRQMVPWGDKLPGRWENSNTDMDRDKLTAYYFSQLEKGEVEKLAMFYRDDFSMFGYSYENFVKI